MAAICDVHVLHLNEPTLWLDACLQSIESPDFNVTVLPGILGQIGQARVNGYSVGTAPYVTCCDPDDTYDVEVMSHMVAILEDNPNIGVVYSGENILDEPGHSTYLFNPYDPKAFLRSPMACHGVIVYRRTLITNSFSGLVRFRFKYERWFSALFSLFTGYEIVGVDMAGRDWRKRVGQTSKKVSSYDTMLIKHYLTYRNFKRLEG